MRLSLLGWTGKMPNCSSGAVRHSTYLGLRPKYLNRISIRCVVGFRGVGNAWIAALEPSLFLLLQRLNKAFGEFFGINLCLVGIPLSIEDDISVLD